MHIPVTRTSRHAVQVLTGESWSEAVARPIIFGWDMYLRGSLFYVSFILICGIVLINVVVAVLLEKMVDNDDSPIADADAAAKSSLLPEGSSSGDEGGNAASVALAQVQDDVAGLREQLERLPGSLGDRLAASVASLGIKLEQQSNCHAEQMSAMAEQIQQLRDIVLQQREEGTRRRARSNQRGHGHASGSRGNGHGHASGSRGNGQTVESRGTEDRAQDGEREPSKGIAGRSVSNDPFGA